MESLLIKDKRGVWHQTVFKPLSINNLRKKRREKTSFTHYTYFIHTLLFTNV